MAEVARNWSGNTYSAAIVAIVRIESEVDFEFIFLRQFCESMHGVISLTETGHTSLRYRNFVVRLFSGDALSAETPEDSHYLARFNPQLLNHLVLSVASQIFEYPDDISWECMQCGRHGKEQ
jgi:hypothetical protein